MAIQEILILTLFTIILGWISRRTQRENLILVFSVVIIYYLQPALKLRYLDFWIPTTTISIIILSWAATSKTEFRKSKENLQTSVLILLSIFGLSMSRYFYVSDYLRFINPPRIEQLFLYFIAIIAILLLLVKSKYSSPLILWISFAVLIYIFIVLKTPALTLKASGLWRSLMGQSTSLASADEIRWLGFSYLAFRILHTIRDKQLGRLPDINLREYVSYVIFFPSFVAGPIDRIENFVKDLKDISNPFQEDVIDGLERIIVGSFKKFVIADSLAIFSLNNQNAIQASSTLGSWILLYAFSFQILFDFSGYTDIAIGLGKLLNFNLPENFKKPYLKTNITQFWNNWHMTLTNWFRSYYFNPISRSLRKKKFPALAILLITQISTMVLVGLWHGITANFLFWGLWHGIGLLVQNRWSAFIKPKIARIEKEPRLLATMNLIGILLTFHFVALGWIWFALDNPFQGWTFFVSLFGVS